MALLGKNLLANAGNLRDVSLVPESGKISWKRAWQPNAIFMPEESHGPEEPGSL